MTMYLRQVRSLCLTLAVMSALPASVVSAQSANPEDEQAIRDVLTRFYEGWNTHDVEKMVSVYAEDIDHINVSAEWNKGKPAIRRDEAVSCRAGEERPQDLHHRKDEVHKT